MKNARARAAFFLSPVLRQQGALNLESIEASDPDRGLIAELCYGTLRYLPSLLILSEKLLRKPLREKDTEVLALLLIGLYQISYLRVSDHAAVSETVQAAKQLKKAWASGLINAALRHFLREQESIVASEASNPVFRLSHPQWLINSIERQWPDQAESIFAAGNSRPPMTLRVNLDRQSRDQFLESLKKAGFNGQEGELSKAAVQLGSAIDVKRIPGFSDGLVSVQDEGAQLAAFLLDPQPGENVLDACAAPGGKTGHLLEYCPEINLVALDLDATRLLKVTQNLDRLRYSAKLQTTAAEDTDKWWSGEPFQCILIDAPCSGTGVMRRHPDIKHLRTPEDISGFRERQLELLEKLWPTLAVGGKLLYVTCSILKSENQDVVNSFANGRDDLLHIELEFPESVSCNPGFQLLPMAERHDGFYYALMGKCAKR